MSETRNLADHLGEEKASEVCDILASWSGRMLTPKHPARLAPSIISRGEAELLGLSEPRFATRVEVQAFGIINLRRIQSISHFFGARKRGARRTEPGWKQYTSPMLEVAAQSETRAGRQRTETEKMIGKSSPIADSLLWPPGKNADGFHILTVDLWDVYGEKAGAERYASATPYMQHVRLTGGGLCAQACCWMVNALLHNDRRDHRDKQLSVHGLAEITWLAQIESERSNELLLSGLHWWEVINYFRRTRRRAFFQKWTTTARADHTSLYTSAVSRHIKCGVPVILPVNSYRFQSAVAHGENDPEHRIDAELDHAVVVIGTSAKGDRLLINDPSSAPFVPLNASQVWSSAEVMETLTASTSTMISVLPWKVRVPLLSWSPIGRKSHSRWYVGISKVNQLYRERTINAEQRAAGQVVRLPDIPPVFALCRLGEAATLVQRSPEFAPVGPYLSLISQSARGKAESECWCWFIVDQEFSGRDHVLTVWNAEKPLHKTRAQIKTILADDGKCREFCRRHLIAIYGRGRTWIRSNMEALPAAVPQHEPAQWRPWPNVALISSYDASGIENAISSWPADQLTACDLYTFMRSDLPFLARATGVPHATMSAAQYMAHLNGIKDGPQKVATAINGLLRSKNLSAAAFTSFLPEVSGTSDRSTAIDAICFLVKMAECLAPMPSQHEQGYPLAPAVIELVVGGLAADFWWADVNEKDRAYPAYVVNIENREDALYRLLEGLEQARINCAEALGYEPNVVWACELEPGPLFALNDLKAMRSLLRLAESRFPLLLPHLGFNLDIAHWSLAGISPDRFEGVAPDVFTRIAHSHISDHGRGHFGDAIIGTVGLAGRHHDPRQVFAPWLELLRRRSAHTGAVPYSGYISVELEACKSPRHAARALYELSLIRH